MNPLTNMKNISKLSEQELHSANKTSWHDQYRNSAWIFIGGLPFDLTEGDIICIFSQYGELVNINLIRDKVSGKSKGFCFLCYEDQRSTDLAVDNFNGIKVMNRTLRVDHVSDYKIPKGGKNTDEETKKLYEEGCAPKAAVSTLSNPLIKERPLDLRETLADQIQADIKLPSRLPIYPVKTEPTNEDFLLSDIKKEKDYEKKKTETKNKCSHYSSSDSDEGERRRRHKKSKKHDTCEESDNEVDRKSRSRKLKKKNHSDSKSEKKSTDYKSKEFSSRSHYADRKRRSRSRSLDKNKVYKKYPYCKDKDHKYYSKISDKRLGSDEYYSKSSSSSKSHRRK